MELTTAELSVTKEALSLYINRHGVSPYGPTQRRVEAMRALLAKIQEQLVEVHAN